MQEEAQEAQEEEEEEISLPSEDEGIVNEIEVQRSKNPHKSIHTRQSQPALGQMISEQDYCRSNDSRNSVEKRLQDKKKKRKAKNHYSTNTAERTNQCRKYMLPRELDVYMRRLK